MADPFSLPQGRVPAPRIPARLAPAPVSTSVDTASHSTPAQGDAAQGAQDAAVAAATAAESPVASNGGEGEGKGRGRGVAIGGKAAPAPGPPPDLPHWPQAQTPVETYVPDEAFDYSDLSQVNLEMNRCRSRLFQVSQMLKGAQREAVDADLRYRRAMRRALVSVSGGSAEVRKALAELQCEPFENDLVVANQVVEELKKRATDCRDDLKAVENLSHNVRAQMDVR